MRSLNLSSFLSSNLSFGARFRRGIVTLLLGVSVVGAALGAAIHYNTGTPQDVVVNSVGLTHQGTNFDGSKRIQHHMHVTRTDGSGKSYYLKVSPSTACAAKPGYAYQTIEKGWGIKFLDEHKTASALNTPDGEPLHRLNSPNYAPDYCQTKPAYPADHHKPHATRSAPVM